MRPVLGGRGSPVGRQPTCRQSGSCDVTSGALMSQQEVSDFRTAWFSGFSPGFCNVWFEIPLSLRLPPSVCFAFSFLPSQGNRYWVQGLNYLWPLSLLGSPGDTLPCIHTSTLLSHSLSLLRSPPLLHSQHLHDASTCLSFLYDHNSLLPEFFVSTLHICTKFFFLKVPSLAGWPH